jgi:hypothetical protein
LIINFTTVISIFGLTLFGPTLLSIAKDIPKAADIPPALVIPPSKIIINAGLYGLAA